MPGNKNSNIAKKSKSKTAKPSAKKLKTKIPANVLKYLEKTGINHDILEHRTVYTALDAAATMRKKIDEIAKSLLVAVGKDYYVVVLPANQNLDFKKLQTAIEKFVGKKINAVKIPGEEVMEKLLKVKAGALSAFGSIYKLPVVAEKSLNKIKKAIFSSGSFNHSVEMAVADFLKAENAIIGSFGVKKKIKTQKIAKPKKVVATTKKIKKKK